MTTFLGEEQDMRPGRPDWDLTAGQRYEKRLRQVWGANISAARKRKGWSQARLEEACGVDQSSIAKYEKASTKPSEGHKNAIAQALGRNPDRMFSLILPPTVARELAAVEAELAGG